MPLFSKSVLLTLAAAMFGNAAGCDPRAYNVYVQNNFNCANSDVEGRLAAGGSVTLANYAIGCQTYNTNPTRTCINMGEVHCSDHPADEPSLVSGGALSLTNTQVYSGSIVYGDSFTQLWSNWVSDCAVSKNKAYGDYIRTAFPSLVSYSNGLKAQAATGNVTNSYGSLTFTATSDSAVFSITSDDLANCKGMTLNVPATANNLVINVSGTTITAGNYGYFGSFIAQKHNLIWNFPDATTLTIANVGWWGSILAPKADVTTSNGVFNGQLWVKSIVAPTGQTCGQFNFAPYTPYSPPSGLCGNGVVDGTEQCDGGVCCNTDCTFVTAASATTCRAAAGECDKVETCSGSSATCPTDLYYGPEKPCGASFGVCDVRLEQSCTGNSAICRGAPPAFIWDWEAFNVLSFDSFTCHGGDVEGRLAVAKGLDVSGFTVGLETLNTDAKSFYDLAVGQDGVFTDGTINNGGGPAATNNGRAYVGGVFTAPQYLKDRVNNGAAFPSFSAAQTYFNNVTGTIAALPTNAVATTTYGNGLLITCSAASSLYHVKVDATTLSSTQYYLTSGCTSDAAWLIDVTGNGVVSLQGAPFPGIVERVVYNVANGNDINANNGVAGNILAPNSDYSQTSGVTYGRLIVGNVTEARQNNKPNCLVFNDVTLQNYVVKPVALGDKTVYLVDIGGYHVGDQLCIGGSCRKILSGETGDIDGDGKIDHAVLLDAPLALTIAPGTVAKTTFSAASRSTQSIPITDVSGTEGESSSAASLVASAFFAVLAMLF